MLMSAVYFLSLLYMAHSDRSREEKFLMETHFIQVPLDHFAADERSFNLRYLLNSNFYHTDGPLFVYIGGERDIRPIVENVGFMFDIAFNFNALLVFIEHRYYGQSLPFGDQTFSNAENLRYLNTAQALADFAFVIDNLKKTYFGKMEISDFPPFIAFGGSYGGMLAVYMRMKYPYIVRGAIASSSPVYQYPGMSSCGVFYEKVTNVFMKQGSEECVEIIKFGWDAINDLSKSKQGLDFITSSLQLCETTDTETLFNWLASIYIHLAAANYPYPANSYVPLPGYPLKIFCNKLTSGHFDNSRSVLNQLNFALQMYTNYSGNTLCNNPAYIDFDEYAWNYQTCTELIMPKCSTNNDMFMTRPWDSETFANKCYNKYGVRNNNPGQAEIAYGGKNFKHYSNMVFTNGFMDAYPCEGLYENKSSSVRSLNIIDAPLQYDFRSADGADTYYIIESRKWLVHILQEWLYLA